MSPEAVSVEDESVNLCGCKKKGKLNQTVVHLLPQISHT